MKNFSCTSSVWYWNQECLEFPEFMTDYREKVSIHCIPFVKYCFELRCFDCIHIHVRYRTNILQQGADDTFVERDEVLCLDTTSPQLPDIDN